LKLPFKQLWSCEIDQFARLSSDANYPKAEQVFTDMTSRQNKGLPLVDLYVCGFPCQSFSLAGKRLGLGDPRTSVIPSMLETIKESKPKIIILENVIGFKSIDNGAPFALLLSILEKNYNVNVNIYNTKDYGLPQNRKRIYFVGIRKDVQKKEFIKPKTVKMKSIESIIDGKNIKENNGSYDYLKYKLTSVSKYHIFNDLFKYHHHIFSGISNTIMTTNIPNIYELNRKFTTQEILQLQGFPKKFKVVASKTQITKQIGNSMSVCVVKKIIKEALKCI
jgi:DNA (cytosine-5)-methyltransferase 1